VFERDGYTLLSGSARPVEVILFSPQGTLICLAQRARLDLRTKDVRLEGRVQARSEQGTELRTESLQWTAASRRVHTDQPVTITRGGLVCQGRGLEAETTLERVRIFQNITSQVRPPAAAGRRVAP
jgi:LPS export ABC transporter protein LptC